MNLPGVSKCPLAVHHGELNAIERRVFFEWWTIEQGVRGNSIQKVKSSSFEPQLNDEQAMEEPPF